jgi:hypothetical protein
MPSQSTTSEGMKLAGHEMEACYDDINHTRTNLRLFVETMPYKSEKAAPRFMAAMNNWDAEFDKICKHLIEMRNILLPQSEQVTLTEENNVDVANFFDAGNSGGGTNKY